MFRDREINQREKNEFILVSKKVPSSSKKVPNPLFNTITALQKSNELSSLSIKSASTSTGAVYYINLPSLEKPCLYPGFKLENSHLTVNEYYQKDKIGINNGLSTVHYTEIYNNLTTSEAIVVHVYFTKQGFFQNQKAKIYPNGQVRENGRALTLNPEQSVQLRENTDKIFDDIKLLITSNQSLYKQAVDSANQIEAKLELINVKKNPSDYYTEAQKFIDQIHQINLFSYGAKDNRGDWMAKFIAKMKKAAEDITKRETTDSDVGESLLEETKSIPMIQVPGIKKVDINKKTSNNYLVIENLVTSINKIKREIQESSVNVKLLIDHNELIDELNFELLMISSDLSKLTKKQREKTTSLIKKEHKKYNLLDIFFDHFWKGNIDIIEELFPIMGHLIEESHIRNLLSKLVKSEPKSHAQDNLKKAFNFLHKNSTSYNFVFQDHTLEAYDLSNAFSTTITVFYSFLLIAYIKNNLFAYKMLLEHGLSPNGLGAVYCDRQIANINAMVGSKNKDKLPYFKLAIEYGARYTNILPHLIINPHGTSIEAQKNLKQSKNNKDALELFESTSKKTIIESCCYNQHYKALELFLSQMTLEHLLDALTYIIITNINISGQHVFPSIEHGCRLTKLDSLNKVIDELVDYEGKTGLYSVLISASANQEQAVELLEKLIELIKNKINELHDHSREELWDLRAKAFQQIKTANTEDEQLHKYNRCILLFMLCPEPDFMMYQSLISLQCQKAARLKRKFMDSSSDESYSMAKSIGEDSCFSEKLIETPVYKFAVSKVEEKAKLSNNHTPTLSP